MFTIPDQTATRVYCHSPSSYRLFFSPDSCGSTRTLTCKCTRRVAGMYSESRDERSIRPCATDVLLGYFSLLCSQQTDGIRVSSALSEKFLPRCAIRSENPRVVKNRIDAIRFFPAIVFDPFKVAKHFCWAVLIESDKICSF